MSYPDIYKEYFGGMDFSKKVIKRRVVGIKGKAAPKRSSSLTREKIASMSPKEYDKYRPQILKALAKGEI